MLEFDRKKHTQIQADTNTGSQLDRHWDCSCKPLSETEKRKCDEDQSFNEHSGQSHVVADWSSSVKSDNSVCEVCVKTHSWCKGDWHVGAESHHERSQCCNSSSSGNKVALDGSETQSVCWVKGAGWIISSVAVASSAAVGENSRVDLEGALEAVLKCEKVYTGIPR